MTRKHFEAVAAVFRQQVAEIVGTPGEVEARTALALVASGLAGVFAADNPRFDRARFLVACGMGWTA